MINLASNQLQQQWNDIGRGSKLIYHRQSNAYVSSSKALSVKLLLMLMLFLKLFLKYPPVITQELFAKVMSFSKNFTQMSQSRTLKKYYS